MKKEIVENILDDFLNINEYDIYIVANIQKKTFSAPEKRIIHAAEDEFFSLKEYAEIASAITNVFGYVRTFYNESEFLEYFIGHKILPESCIIFNFSRDGKKEGKKSLIPSFCDLYGYRYTGSNAFVISLLRNKYLFTKYLEAHDIKVPISSLYPITNDYSKFINKKVIIKYNNESASIGLEDSNIITYQSLNQLKAFHKKMCSNTILIQEYIEGIECEVLVLETSNGYKSLDPVKIVFANNIISNQISNSYNYSFDLLSNTISNYLCDKICETAELTAKLLGVKGYARFDFRINLESNNFYLFDIAGSPYVIKHSSPAYLFTKIYKLKYEDIFKVLGEVSLYPYLIN